MVPCKSCRTENPKSNRYCGACGEALEQMLVLDESAITEMVRTVLRNEFTDTKVLEIETAQSIASRLLDWSKLFGFFVGIPLGLLLIGLGFLGIKTFADFSSIVEKGKVEIGAQVTAAKHQISALNAEGTALNQQYAALRARLSDNERLASQVEVLTRRVDVLGEKLGFAPTSMGTPALNQRLSQAFGDFAGYLHTFGYSPNAGRINIDIRNELDQPGTIAYYNFKTNTMEIDQKYANDPANMYREYMHHVLYQGDRGNNINDSHGWMYSAIESGLAAYFPCSFLNNPRALAPWDLGLNLHQLPDITDEGGAMRVGTELWGSAFWEMRSLLGAAQTNKLLYATWLQLRPGDADTVQAAVFVRKLLDQVDATQRARLRAIFASRGVVLKS